MVREYRFDRSEAPGDLDLRRLTRVCEDTLVGAVGHQRPDWRGKIMALVAIASRDNTGNEYLPVYSFKFRNIVVDEDKYPDDDPAAKDNSTNTYLCKYQMSSLEYGASGSINLSGDYRVECRVIYRDQYGERNEKCEMRIQQRYRGNLEIALAGNSMFFVAEQPPL